MSTSRRCDIWLATDGKWYMRLGDFEYANDEADCSLYGPFPSEAAVQRELNRHSNPGGAWIDESGTEPPPTRTAR